MVNKNVIFLSYGNESEYLRTVFCILSFSAWDTPNGSDLSIKGIRIIIYTDNPDFFADYLKGLPIEYYLLTPVLLEEMLGTTGFFHRRKVAVIDLTFKQYPEDELLFIDSDTFFIAEPKILLQEFEAGKSFMHKREYRLEKAIDIFSAFNQGQYPKAFLEYITNRNFTVGGTSESFSHNDYSWNSGVLGLHKDFAAYMPDVFQLTDEFYTHSKWFISEQLAFALILQRKTQISRSDPFILHYWGLRQKTLIDKLIAELFDKTSPAELVKGKGLRNLTLEWQNTIMKDLILEKSVISLKQKYWLYGIKMGVRVILKDPLNVNIYKELLAAIKS